jgi:ADP-heptose:LPS heptosyltransferase
MTPKRILVLQLARLGDLVQTWPLLHRLRHAYPGVRLSLLTDQRLLPLQGVAPPVEEHLGFDFVQLAALAERDWPAAYNLVAGLLEKLRTRRYDLVFNLNFSRLSLLLTHLLDCPAQGYLPVAGGRDFLRDPWLAFIYSLVHARRFNRFHLTDVFRHLAPAPGETAPAPDRPATGDQFIALQLATRHPRRTWPLEHFTWLARLLLPRWEGRLLLLGTAAERPLGERLRAALPEVLRERVVNLQGRTSLEELAELLGRVQLLVSGDTGTLHLAAGLGVQVVALFLGPAMCFETGPYGSGHYVLQAEPSCHPCAEAASPCPEQVQVCSAMLPPQPVAHLVFSLLEQGAVSANGGLPAGARLYRSRLEPFGVFYEPLEQSPPRFEDLVGQAYRQAGASLAGEPLSLTPAVSPSLSTDTRQDLQAVLQGATNGGPPPEQPAVASALKPLAAFSRELARAGRPELFAPVRAAFTAQLEQVLSAEF